jgi:hypothetical protein
MRTLYRCQAATGEPTFVIDSSVSGVANIEQAEHVARLLLGLDDSAASISIVAEPVEFEAKGREARKAAWSYAWGRHDAARAAGDGGWDADLILAFGEAWGVLWEAFVRQERHHLPTIHDCWARWFIDGVRDLAAA